MFEQAHILDITTLDRWSEAYKTLKEFARHTEMYQNTIREIDVLYIQEILDSEETEFKEGWYQVISMMADANIFRFYLHN